MATQPDELPEEDEEVIVDADPEEESVEDDGEPELVIELEGSDESDITADLPDDTVAMRAARHRIREMARENAAKDAKIREYEAAKPAAEIKQRARPTLEAHGYDEDAYDKDLLAWHDEQREIDNRKTSQQRAQQEVERKFNESYLRYRANAAKVGIPDFDNAEKTVADVLPPELKRAIPIYMEEKGPALVAALARHPQHLDRIVKLSATDGIAALLEMDRMSRGIKVEMRKKPPAPESATITRSSAPISIQSTDKRMAALEKEAERTGDYSKLVAHKVAAQGAK